MWPPNYRGEAGVKPLESGWILSLYSKASIVVRHWRDDALLIISALLNQMDIECFLNPDGESHDLTDKVSPLLTRKVIFVCI